MSLSFTDYFGKFVLAHDGCFFFFISIVPIIAFVAMEEIYYSMGRVCRRPKMVDGSGFGSLYCVKYRDASKSLAWHVLIQGKFISDVVVCNFGGLFEG